MDRHPITLMASDSRYADESAVSAAGISPDALPSGWHLLVHQLGTWQALQDENVDIVVNEALTGDGKTLAAQLPSLLLRDTYSLFMYPTNELIRDQARGLERTLQAWQRDALAVQQVNSRKLDELESTLETGRMAAVRTALRRDLILTNPDVFHLLMQLRYVKFNIAPDQLVNQIALRFGHFVFDEFHLFGTPQVGSVLIAIWLLRVFSKHKPRFLFLSATPQTMLREFARQSGLTVRVISGQYEHNLAERPPEGYRRILQPVDLYLWSSALEDWVQAHVDDVIRAFFTMYLPGAKGVIIANSVATAHRLFVLCKELLAEDAVTIALNTGLTGYDERQASHDADLIIGTSTIDVGVDFHINLLIFESTDAASHMQRLGRLGRHNTDSRGNPFEHYEAHALLPPWVVATIEAETPASRSIDREQYSDLIGRAFTSANSFQGYELDWGSLQAAHVLHMLENKTIRQTHRRTMEQVEPAYTAIFKHSRPKYYWMRKNQPNVLREAASFRGNNTFMALVVDSSRGQTNVTTYNLLTLLRQGELEAEDKERILDETPDSAALKRHEPLIAYRLRGWRSKARRLTFRLDRKIDNWSSEKFGVVREQKGFRIDLEPGDVPHLWGLSRDVARLSLVVTLVCDLSPKEIQRRLRLGWQLGLYEFISDDNVRGSVAFNRDALLLETAIRRSGLNAGGSDALIL